MVKVSVVQGTYVPRSTTASLLANAFANDALIKWVQPDLRSRYRTFYATLFMRDMRCVDIALYDGEPVGVAVWDMAGRHPSVVRRITSIPLWVWAAGHGELGKTVRGRASEMESRLRSVRPSNYRQCDYLVALGVLDHGKGVGTALLNCHLGRSQAPGFLEASSKNAVLFYSKFGYETLDKVCLRDGPTFWPMYRRGYK